MIELMFEGENVQTALYSSTNSLANCTNREHNFVSKALKKTKNTLMHFFSVCAQTHHSIRTVYATSSSWDAWLRRHPRPGRKRDVSGENITHRSEPWQSEGLSEMVPRGTEMEGERRERVKRGADWDSLPA